MKSMFWLLVLAILPTSVFAQEGPNPQVRIPVHIQVLLRAPTEAKDRFGLAMWGILPDVTAEKNQMATVAVVGFLWQHDKKNWVEFLAGARLNQNGYKDPILNIRALNNLIPGVTVSAEIQQSFRVARRRTLYWLAADMPTGLGKLRAGRG